MHGEIAETFDDRSGNISIPYQHELLISQFFLTKQNAYKTTSGQT